MNRYSRRAIQRLLSRRADSSSSSTSYSSAPLHHGIPTTRRQLLSQGLITAGSFVAMPSLLSLIARRAEGAAGCKAVVGNSNRRTPVLIVDGAGGWNIPGRNVIVGGAGGQQDFLGDAAYATLGLMPEAVPGAVGVTMQDQFGLLMHPASRFHGGMLAATQASTQAQIDGVIFCTRSGDDTGNNPHNPAFWLRQAGADGDVVSILGTQDSTYGGRAMGPSGSYEPAYKPVRVTTPQTAKEIVAPGLLLEAGGQPFVEAVMNATKIMSESRIAAFNRMPVEQQADVLCAYTNAKFQATSFDEAALDPLADDDINAANGGVYDFNDGTEARAGSLAKLLLDGYAGVATLQIGGCDYHNNDLINNVDPKDEEVGKVVGQFLEAAARKNTDAVVYVFTDGGTSASGTGSNDPATGRFGPTNDSGTRSSALMFAYGANGRPPLLSDRRQIGHFNQSGAVEVVNSISDSPATLAELVVANYLALHMDPSGVMAELDKIVGNNSLGNDPLSLLSFGRFS